ncbi:sulfotransferase family protein [Mycobacterium neumannii]|uniref:sulfotransferase family protein n=1 Tax=Mycobacterium neumannii TaxID=2048551 RepID=UPI000F8475DA|nr:sulfotransferase family protein [Mycobacterium neumannii]
MNRDLILVLGVARSGTSALTRVLSLCGASLPPALVVADKHNPRGYFESRRVLHLNARILHRQRVAFHSLAADDVPTTDKGMSAVRRYLETLPATPLLVIKDPQIITLTSTWVTAARQAGYRPVAVLPIRHPAPVISSMTKLDVKPSPELAAALWLKYTLLAERHTRDLPRLFVNYGNLLNDWRSEVKRIASRLDIDLRPDTDAVDEFLSPSSAEHVSLPQLCGTDWIETVYRMLHDAAVYDAPVNTPALDAILTEYRACERDMNTALADARRLSSMQRFFPPGVTALLRELAALVSRQRD